jgi:hypothetical protein
MNLVKMILKFALPNVCKVTVEITAFLLLRMNIVIVTIKSLSCVKLAFAIEAPGSQVFVHLDTLIWFNGRCCRSVLVKPELQTEIERFTVASMRSHRMTWIEVGHSDLGR